jgi:hypothetical protein
MISITLFSCQKEPKYTYIYEFNQDAEILQFKSFDNSYKTASGNFFLGSGTITSSETSYKVNTFYVINKNGEQVLIKALPSKIKFKLDKKNKVPTVYFNYYSDFPFKKNIIRKGDFMNNIVEVENYADWDNINDALLSYDYSMYVVITCNPNLFPSDYDFLTYK